MTDNFSLLNETRRPWLDQDALKSRFLSLSSEVHPDRLHNASPSDKAAANKRYAELNAAYNCLREPKDRLAHLLELESGAPLKDVQRIPPGTMDLFMEVGQICRDVDTFLASRAKETSPLLKIRFFEKGIEWTDKLNHLQQQINSKRDALFEELKSFDESWAKAPAIGSPERKGSLPLARLEEICRGLSYVARWNGQISERSVQLAV